MVKLAIGDLVVNHEGTLHYYVRSVGKRGFVSLEPLRREPGRRAVRMMRAPRLVRSAELVRFFTLIGRARRYLLERDDPHSAAAMLTQAGAWLSRAEERGADDIGEIAWALVALKSNRRQLAEEARR